MKDILFSLLKSSLMISSLVMGFGLASCKCSNDKSKEEEIAMYEQEYIDACAEGDFEKARKSMQKLEGRTYLYDNHVRYVNDKEIYALLAKPSRDNDARIMYLYNTYESTQLPNMRDVIEVAISMGNENLPEKLMKAGVEPNDTIIIAAVNADSNDLVEFILKKKPIFIFNEEVADYYKNEKGLQDLNSFMTDAFIKNPNVGSKDRIIKVAMKSDNEKLVELLINNSPKLILDSETAEYYKSKMGEDKFLSKIGEIISKDPESAQKNPVLQNYLSIYPSLKNAIYEYLRKKINEISKTAPHIHTQGIVDYDTGSDYTDDSEYSEAKGVSKRDKDNKAIKEYNEKLAEIYNKALDLKRKDIAMEAVNSMKPFIETYFSDDEKNTTYKGYRLQKYQYLIYYNYDDINRLKQNLR